MKIKQSIKGIYPYGMKAQFVDGKLNDYGDLIVEIKDMSDEFPDHSERYYVVFGENKKVLMVYDRIPVAIEYFSNDLSEGCD